MTPEKLLQLERDLELEFAAKHEDALHKPITDGVVNAEQYLASSPRILWILKEPWEELAQGERGGGWSVSKDVAGKGVKTNRGALTMMAYITYSVFNGFPAYDEMDYATNNPAIGNSLGRIAFINIKKLPGGKSSYEPEIAAHHRKNRSLLLRQVEVLAPEIIIGGRTLHHFFSDFGLEHSMFNKDRSAWFCRHEGRLFIHAYHPARRGSLSRYVDEIAGIIREDRAALN